VPNKYNKNKDPLFTKHQVSHEDTNSILANLSDSTDESLNDSICNISEYEPLVQVLPKDDRVKFIHKD